MRDARNSSRDVDRGNDDDDDDNDGDDGDAVDDRRGPNESSMCCNVAAKSSLG
jgi:hypothetical protein